MSWKFYYRHGDPFGDMENLIRSNRGDFIEDMEILLDMWKFQYKYGETLMFLLKSSNYSGDIIFFYKLSYLISFLIGSLLVYIEAHKLLKITLGD